MSSISSHRSQSPLATITPGVLAIEGANKVWSPLSKTFLFVGIALVAYVYSLDGSTSYLYLAFATSSFSDHSLLSSIGVAQAIILAVAKPPSAKIADVFGRAQAYTVAVILYVVGYIIVASCNSIGTYAAGIIIYAAGQAAVQILQQIIIADVTSLKWRGFVSSLVSLPFFINAFVGSNIGAAVNANGPNSWRWGYGMLAIIIAVASSPIIITLAWGQRKASKLGIIATNYSSKPQAIEIDHRSFVQRAYAHLAALDLFGLILFGVGWSLFLIPITLVNNAENTWQSPKVISMIVIGIILLLVFGFYEAKFASLPVLPFRFLKNKTVLFCCIIAFFDFISFYLQFTYQYSFIYITHSDWSNVNQNYFAYIQTLALTLFAILAGIYQLYFRRLKWLLVVGLFIRLIGVGIMIYTKGAHGSTAGLVLTQVVQGLGGGIAACSTQTAVQAVVSHQDVASVTAVYLLAAEIGGAIGTTIAGAVWRNYMPLELDRTLAGLANQTTIDNIFGSIYSASSYPINSPILNGVISAYDSVMVRLLIISTCLAVIPVVAAFFIEDIELLDTQNAVEDDGKRLERGAESDEKFAADTKDL